MICPKHSGNVRVPDGFSGALLACESVRDGAVILHGPTGCRGLHGAMSDRFFPRLDAGKQLNYAERFYFSQSRIPTTYLDGDDYVFGGREKLTQAIAMVVKHHAALVTVINSPGAALIGDDLQRCATEAAPFTPCATIEMPMLSHPFAAGYQQGVISILEALSLKPQTRIPRAVVLVGLSIAHQHWSGSIEELRRLLGLCGIEVLCAVGAGSATDEYQKIPQAACYAVIHDEYANCVAPWLERQYGGTIATSSSGAPIGFSATIEWITAVAHAAHVDPTPAINDIRDRRRQVSRMIDRASSYTEALKGIAFAVQADPSFALPLVQWLYQYLGMLPVSVETPDFYSTDVSTKLHTWLESIGCGDVWQTPWHLTDSEILFADGQEVLQARSGNKCGGIEVAFPSGRVIDIVPKSMLGALGSAWLVENILSEVRCVLWT
jgi:nitrogenase molybdenum-iron protein alpha/beta subunit